MAARAEAEPEAVDIARIEQPAAREVDAEPVAPPAEDLAGRRPRRQEAGQAFAGEGRVEVGPELARTGSHAAAFAAAAGALAHGPALPCSRASLRAGPGRHKHERGGRRAQHPAELGAGPGDHFLAWATASAMSACSLAIASSKESSPTIAWVTRVVVALNIARFKG